MQLYYHVFYIDERKCKTNFSYIKSENVNILGSVAVGLTENGKLAVFDKETDILLNDAEKEFIVSNILRNLNFVSE